jgi:hypothetical protein
MKPIRLPLALVAMLLMPIELSSAQEGQGAMRIYDQIKNVLLDENKVAEAKSLVLTRDAAVFRLNTGKICLFQPVEGRVTGAVFVGEGVFEFSPPTEIERYQLNKFTEQENLSEAYEELFLLFSDTTAAELEHKLSFSPGEVPLRLASIRSDCHKRVSEEKARNLCCRVLEQFLADSSQMATQSQGGRGFFYADINTLRLERLLFTFDPAKVEEVALERPAPTYYSVHARDLICSFHRAEDYARSSVVKDTPLPGERMDAIKVMHYRMEVEISGTKKLSANVDLDFESLMDGINVVSFRLHPDLEIERVTNSQGDSLCFIREKERYGVSVLLTRPTSSAEERRLTFKYSGKIIDQNWYGDFYIRSGSSWYPRYGYLPRATYDLTFKSPRAYEFVSIGKKTKEWTEGDHRCTQWVEDFPTSQASFNYGRFKIHGLEHEGIPPVSVYYLEESDKKFTADFNRFLGQYGDVQIMLLDSKSKENIGADLVNSLNFFQTVYGKCPFPKLAATEIPASYGVGYPGLVHLSWGTFMGEGELPETKFKHVSFRAHEVAHQWWAHTVREETYHDRWLTEGFAEYSGAWFAQMSTQDNEGFFEQVEEWRKDIMGKGHKESVGSEAGPLWLGYRLNSSESSDYATLVYEKGAFVLHMLRNLMMDYNARSDSSFIAMMRDFVETHYGKEASTEDFKEIVEKHVGEDMDWFFDQWVYGVGIPTYKFSYSTEPTADGKYIVSCEVDQENVPEDFRMWVPILLDFGMNQHAILRLWVDKPHNEYQLPKAPMMPREVTLNPAHAVLCEVKNK